MIAVALDSSDNIHVVFPDPSFAEIYYKRSTDGGLSWAETKRLTWNSGLSYEVSIATDSNDNIHIVWRDDSYGGTQTCYKKSTNGGDSWSAAMSISGASVSTDCPDIAIDSNNHIHVVWDSGLESLFYNKSTDEGVTWDGAKKLSMVGHRPAMAVDSNNHIHVAWEGWPSSGDFWETYYSRSTDGGTTWTKKRLTWSGGWWCGSSNCPDVAIDTSNNIHVVWSKFIYEYNQIYYKKGIQ
jgi:hypothetical protein